LIGKREIEKFLLLSVLVINFSVTGLVIGGEIFNQEKFDTNTENRLVNSIESSFMSSDLQKKSDFDLITDSGKKNSHISRSESNSKNQFSYFRVLPGGSGQQPSDFSSYKSIKINSNKISGSENLQNFPLLISIFDTNLKTDVQTDGDDIVFANSSSWLDHEIEEFNPSYNSTHAHLVAWVRIPSLSATIDSEIFMYYGNTTIGNLENPSGVWDNNYRGVWHLSETTGGTDTIKDSTTNVNHGTDYNSPIFGQTGKIHNSIELDGTNQYIELPNSATLENITEGDYTYEVWFYADQVPPGTVSSANDKRYAALIKRDPHGGIFYDHDKTFSIEHWLNGPTQTGVTSVAYDPQSYYHIVGVVSKTDGYTKLYVNGILEGTDTWTAGTTAHNYGTVTLKFGIANPGAAIYRWNLDGRLDEMRVSNAARSSDWIATEYNNQNNPSSFISVGSEYSKLNQQEFPFRKTITINNSKVNGSTDMTSFPLLIKHYDTDLQIKAQPDGDDILFSDEDGFKLNHEIERYNQYYNDTHAELVTWVQLPILFASTDTNVIMYYGNSTVSNQENSTEVWNNNYSGVWHLSENPIGTMFDSTLNYNDGTPSNNPTQVVGKINYGLNFDDTNERAVNVSHSSSLQLSSTIVTSAWIKTTDIEPDVGIIVSKWGLNTANRNYWLGKLDTNWFAYFVDDTQKILYPLNNLNDGIWHYVVGVAEGSSLRLLIDGLEVNSTSYDGTSVTGTSDLAIGHGVEIIDQEWEGSIDEVRVSSNWVSIDWIATEFNNQFDPENFYLIGNEEVVDTWPQPDLVFKKPISIDNNKVNSSNVLNDFPILFELFDSDLHDRAQSDGSDITFADETGFINFDHEIEVFNKTYNNTHAHLVAWIQLPRLYGTIDTNITMFYGNSSILAQENPTGVWDSNYIGVWHFNEEGSGTRFDSTSNNNDGTPSNYDGDEAVPGLIGGSDNLDGVNDYIQLNKNASVKGSTQVTFEGWINIDILNGTSQNIYYETVQDDPVKVRLVVHITTSNELRFAGRTPDTDSSASLWGFVNDVEQTLTTNSWFHIVSIFDSESDVHRIYLNGVEYTIPLSEPAFDNVDPQSNPYFGALGSGSPDPFNGTIDEFRISNISRSAEWIRTEYINQLDPTSFYSVGIQEQFIDLILVMDSPNFGLM
jgi:hypothetical protein